MYREGSHVTDSMLNLLASDYALQLKTLSYHWNVRGEHFPSYHALFEEQYGAMAPEIDMLAEHIRALGDDVPAGLEEFASRSAISTGRAYRSIEQMLKELHKDHLNILEQARCIRKEADSVEDIATVVIMENIMEVHGKMAWMLHASLEK